MLHAQKEYNKFAFGNLIDVPRFLVYKQPISEGSYTMKKVTSSTFTTITGLFLLGILLFLIIPFTYGVSLPGVYYINQLIFFAMMSLLVYFNTKYLAPKLLFKKKVFQYYSVLLLGSGLILLLMKFSETALRLPELVSQALHPEKPALNSQKGYYFFYIFIVQLLILGINISAIIIEKWKLEETLRIETEEKKLAIELALLKSQINPHFLFNALNTINALTYSDVEKSRFALSKLSNIMRYLLYENAEKHTPLEKEIAFIDNYIELMQLRLPARIQLIYQKEIGSKNVWIAPMLLMPFIENSFKHGITHQKEDNCIKITLTFQPPFLILETLNPIAYEIHHEPNGIGIENTIRRLDLLYAHQYKLERIATQGHYRIHLKIKL